MALLSGECIATFDTASITNYEYAQGEPYKTQDCRPPTDVLTVVTQEFLEANKNDNTTGRMHPATARVMGGLMFTRILMSTSFPPFHTSLRTRRRMVPGV